MRKDNSKVSRLPIIAIVLLFLMPLIATAMTETQVPVSTDSLHEENPDVWGRYITWEKWVDKNSDGVKSWTEPCWIMLHDTTTGVSRAVTPTEDAGFRQGTNYYFAIRPKIYQDHIVYIDYVGTAYNIRTIKMYNITQNTTWEVSYYNQLDIQNTQIDFIDISGDWIAIGNATGTNTDLYLYNYDDNIARTVSAWDETNIDVTGMYISNQYITYTEKNTATNVYTLGIYNLTEPKNAVIEFPVSISDISSVSSVYENNVAFSYKETGDWDTAIINANVIDWDSSGWTGTPPSKSYNWVDIQDNVTIIDDNDDYDSHNPYIWDNYVAYNGAIVGTDHNILIYNIESESTYNLTNNPYKQEVFAIYENKVVWKTNENSLVAGTGYDANFDIYRTQTDLEELGQDIINMTPMIIIVLFFGFVLGAFVLFGRGGDSF